MVQRKWTNKEIDGALARIGERFELPPERSAALEARVRRDVIARFGSFIVPVRPVVHTPLAPVRGTLVSLFSFQFRPAFALAGILVVVVGASVFGIRAVGDRAPARPPIVSTSAPVAREVVADVTPGSGAAVSVFTLARNDVGAAPPVVVRQRTPVRTVRRADPLTPAEGVFTTWGTSVFSERELARMRAREIGVFGQGL